MYNSFLTGTIGSEDIFTGSGEDRISNPGGGRTFLSGFPGGTGATPTVPIGKGRKGLIFPNMVEFNAMSWESVS